MKICPTATSLTLPSAVELMKVDSTRLPCRRVRIHLFLTNFDKFSSNTIFFAFPAGPATYDGYVCSTKGSVVGAILTVLLLQLGLIGAFWVFYRSKQRHWEKLGGGDYDPRTIHSHTHSTTSSTSSFPTSPEVIFRSVYDRLSAGGRRILIPYPNSQNSSTHSRGGN